MGTNVYLAKITDEKVVNIPTENTTETSSNEHYEVTRKSNLENHLIKFFVFSSQDIDKHKQEDLELLRKKVLEEIQT